MYNGHDYLSCIKIPAMKQTTTKIAQKDEKMEPMDFVSTRRDLISIADRVFGDSEWCHSISEQTLDYVEIVGAKYCVGCVTFVTITLANGKFHKDIGFYSAEESTKGLAIYNARIGSAIDGLKRTLLSFGDKVEKELQELQQKRINPEQINDIQKSIVQSLDDKQTQKKSNVSVGPISMPQADRKNLDANKETDPFLIPDMNNVTTDANPAQSAKAQNDEVVQSSPDKKKIKLVVTDDVSDTIGVKMSEGGTSEAIRLERKKRQMEKQIEFKRYMMEKKKLIKGNNKPNPKY